MQRSKSRKAEVVNNKVLIVGVDIAKKTHYARFVYPDGSHSKSFPFSNSLSGFEELVSYLNEALKEEKLSKAVVGIESTGHYWKPLAYYLDKQPSVHLVQVNPAHVKKAKEIYDSSPGKTDKKDTGVIGMLVQMGRFQELNLPKQDFLSLRFYAKQREQKIVELGVQRNFLHSYVDLIFPEYCGIFKKLESKSSLYILERYTVPESMVQTGLKRLTDCLRTVSRGQLSDERAGELLAAAKTSIGLQDGIEAAMYAVRSTVRTIKQIQLEIQEVEERMTECLQKIPYAKQLLSIHGMGPVSLSITLGELGDINRYHTAKEALKLAGLNLYEISSGQQKGRRKISKKGRPLLRKTLFFAALRMVKSGGAFRQDYLRLTEQNNMHKTKALVALSRKLVRVIFALARDGVLFQQPDTAMNIAA